MLLGFYHCLKRLAFIDGSCGSQGCVPSGMLSEWRWTTGGLDSAVLEQRCQVVVKIYSPYKVDAWVEAGPT